jgi:hypothetical protein
MTRNDAVVPESLRALHRGPGAPRVRRMIERPVAVQSAGSTPAAQAVVAPDSP